MLGLVCCMQNISPACHLTVGGLELLRGWERILLLLYHWYHKQLQEHSVTHSNLSHIQSICFKMEQFQGQNVRNYHQILDQIFLISGHHNPAHTIQSHDIFKHACSLSCLTTSNVTSCKSNVLPPYLLLLSRSDRNRIYNPLVQIICLPFCLPWCGEPQLQTLYSQHPYHQEFDK